MNLIRNIVRLTANRYKNARFSTVFLTITLILSMFVISVATSFVAQILQAQDAKKKAMPPHGMAVNFYCEGEEEFKIDALKDMLSVAKSGQGVMIHQVLIHIDKDDVGSYVPVSAQYLGADGQWQYPITQGRSYTKQEICQGKKVVLIGKSLRHLVEKKNGKSYLSLGKQQYEVLGEVGVKNQSSLWDNRLFVPATALPKDVENQLHQLNMVSMIVYSQQGDTTDLLESMKKEGQKQMKTLTYDEPQAIETGDVLKDLSNSQNRIFPLAVMGYLLSLLYSINIMHFWLGKRRYEIGVRKAFGFTNKKILALVMEEMFGILFIAWIVTMVIQWIIKMCAGTIFTQYTLSLYKENILIGGFIVIFTTCMVALTSIRKILKISPAIILKEGDTNA